MTMELTDPMVEVKDVHKDKTNGHPYQNEELFLQKGAPISATPESLVEDVVGCGVFQWVMIFLVTILAKIPTSATFMFMAFGNYNPGWRCMDNITTIGANDNNNSTNVERNFSNDYSVGSCDAYESCNDVEFNPDSSTIVTEWGLICNRSWISSLIISVQMIGALIGSIIAGHLGDSFGRKTVVYVCIAAMAVLNTVSMFSVSWQAFAILRFFLGAVASSLLAVYYVLTNEFLPHKWRAPNGAIPAWNVGTIIFSVIAFLVRDWKYLHLAAAVLAVIAFVPVIWVPESIRWLAVKQKDIRFIKAAEKMARLNKKALLSIKDLKIIVKTAKEESNDAKKFGLQHLFHSGFKYYTILMSVLWMSFSMIYYAISFGVKSMYGDFYINLILLFALEIPFSVFPSFVPNLIGRTKSGALFTFLAATFILIATGIDLWGSEADKVVGSVFLLLAKVTLNNGWCIVILHTTEIYPTVVRSLSLGWGCLMARVGGIIGPFIIPDDPGSFYVAFIVMAILALCCCVGIMQLPETKGRPLLDNFNEEDNTDQDCTEKQL